jgi:hypothetical protein
LFEYTYLPKPYQEMYLGNLAQHWEQGISTRRFAEYVTLGQSERVVAPFEAAKGAVEGVSDIYHGETGTGTEKLLPAVLLILTVIIGKKLARLRLRPTRRALRVDRWSPVLSV